MSESRNPQFNPQPGDVLLNMYGTLVKVTSVSEFGDVAFECPPGSAERFCDHDTWALHMAASTVVQLA